MGAARSLVMDEVQDLTGDGIVDLQDRLIHHGFVSTHREGSTIATLDNMAMNRMILFSWPFFALYLLLQPWLSNWANNAWYDYTAEYTVYERNGTTEGTYTRPGICDTPAEYFHCTDGQNFTALALKYRGKAVGCGCGQGFLGEGLCPITSYGYTLSDYVSTEPGIAAMLGLGFFPLLGTWRNTMIINRLAKPSIFFERLHMRSLLVFQASYILWGIASDCIFPLSHAILTVVFLGAFFLHWVITALICIAFWNLNYGWMSYAFWAAEAGGLSLTFGAYPIILILVHLFPQYSDLNKDGTLEEGEKELFKLWPDLDAAQEAEEVAA